MRTTVHKRRPIRGTRRRYVTDIQYIQQLKRLYPSCVHDTNKDKLCTQYNGHTITYGEMTYEGIETLYVSISKYAIPEYFLDVGGAAFHGANECGAHAEESGGHGRLQ